jgi:23S rRNA (uracil1939-C5)-methyltransferase
LNAAVTPHDDPVTLTVTALAHGGDGVARLSGPQGAGGEGPVVFIPRTAPGDVVVANLRTAKDGTLRGEPIAIVSPGPNRVPPGCVHFDQCGGCQWRHISIDAQRAAKRQHVIDTLVRVGGFAAGVTEIVAPVVAVSEADGYRHRARFHVTADSLGFQAAGSHRTIDVADCPQLHPAVQAALSALRAAFEGQPFLRTGITGLEIVASPETGDAAVLVNPRDAAPNKEGTNALKGWALAVMRAAPMIKGVVFAGGREPNEPLLFGAPTLSETMVVDGAADSLPRYAARYAPGDFTQVNRAGNRALIRAVLDRVASTARVAEFFAGSGNFSVPLALRGATVEAVESAPAAVTEARHLWAAVSAQAATGGKLTIHRGDAARLAGAVLAASGGADTALLDPPRAGALDLARHIAGLPAASPLNRIVYVACEPATFARDAAILSGAGWALESVLPVDLFPQTFHIELVACFTR